MAQTSKESVEKKFKDVFERSPGAFPEGTSLEASNKKKILLNRKETISSLP